MERLIEWVQKIWRDSMLARVVVVDLAKVERKLWDKG